CVHDGREAISRAVCEGDGETVADRKVPPENSGCGSIDDHLARVRTERPPRHDRVRRKRGGRGRGDLGPRDGIASMSELTYLDVAARQDISHPGDILQPFDVVGREHGLADTATA